MQFVIQHGTFGSKDGNWFPWLDKELSKLGQHVIRPQLPVDDYGQVAEILKKDQSYSNPKQSKRSWLESFEEKVIPKLNKEPLVMVGHSLAPAFILSAASRFDLNLDSAIFVSPFIEDLNNEVFDVINNDFYRDGFDFADLKERIPNSYVLYSDNDPYVPNSAALDVAKKLNSQKIMVRGADHMGGVFKEFPLVLELCKTRIGFGK